VNKTVCEDKGFTLIELLISLVMLSIILGALYSTFFLAHKAVNGLDESLLKLQESRLFLDSISREIDAALYSPGNRKSGFKAEDRDLYGKQTSRLTFTSFSPLRPGLSAITYYVGEQKGILTLYKKISDTFSSENEPKNETKDETNTAELMEGLESFSVEINDNGSWIKTWDTAETKRIPQEIRVTITVRIKDRQVSMYEIMRPRIGRSL
jgi:prepilin-type N-terminal cleavage/methylation domain-containing protein